MKNATQFNVSKGDDLYIAEGVHVPVVTQARTLDELTQNIREALALHLEDEDSATCYLIQEPSSMS
jgi:predicted RNase H-like HicB family nuclease